MALFESYERRIDQINAVLNSYGISSIEEAEKITKDAGLDVYDQVSVEFRDHCHCRSVHEAKIREESLCILRSADTLDHTGLTGT